MWLAAVAVRAARSTRATTRSPVSNVPRSSSTTIAWSSPTRTTSTTRIAQSPVSHSIVPLSATWPPPVA